MVHHWLPKYILMNDCSSCLNIVTLTHLFYDFESQEQGNEARNCWRRRGSKKCFERHCSHRRVLVCTLLLINWYFLKYNITDSCWIPWWEDSFTFWILVLSFSDFTCLSYTCSIGTSHLVVFMLIVIVDHNSALLLLRHTAGMIGKDWKACCLVT